MEDIVRKLNQIEFQGEFQGESLPSVGFPNIWKQARRLYTLKNTKETFQSSSMIENGAFEWMRRIHNASTRSGKTELIDIAFDKFGNVWIIGNSTFGAIYAQPDITIQRESGATNSAVFVIKYDSSGKFEWITWLKSRSCTANGICVNNGQAYICGRSFEAITGIREPKNSSDTTSGVPTPPLTPMTGTNNTGFVLSLTKDGKLDWFRYVMPTYPSSITFKNDMVYICGTGSTSISISTDSTIGKADYSGSLGFLCCMDISGTVQWLRGVSLSLGFVKTGSDFIVASGAKSYSSRSATDIASDISLIPAQSEFLIPTNDYKPTTVTTSNHITINSGFIIIYDLSGNCTGFHWILSPNSVSYINFTIDPNDIIYVTGTSNRSTVILKYRERQASGSITLPEGPSDTLPHQFLIKYSKNRKTTEWVKWFNIVLYSGFGIASNSDGVYLSLTSQNGNKVQVFTKNSDPINNPEFVDLIVPTISLPSLTYYAKFDLAGNFKWSSSINGVSSDNRDTIVLLATTSNFLVLQSPSSSVYRTYSINVTDMDQTYPNNEIIQHGPVIAKFGLNWFNFVKTFYKSYKSIQFFISQSELTGNEIMQVLTFIDENEDRTSAWNDYTSKSSSETLTTTATLQLESHLLTIANNKKTEFPTVSGLQTYTSLTVSEFEVAASQIVQLVSDYLKLTYFPEYTLIFNRLTSTEKSSVDKSYILDATQFSDAIDILEPLFYVPPGIITSIVPISTAESTNITSSGVNTGNTSALPFKAFDNKSTTSWESGNLTDNTGPVWISWRSDTAKSIIGYELDLAFFGPSDFQLQAKNETSDPWTTLHTETGYKSLNTNPHTFSHFFTVMTATYKEYRLFITKRQEASTQVYIRIHGIRFLEYTGTIAGGKFNQLTDITASIKHAIDGVEAIVLARSFAPAYEKCVPLYISEAGLNIGTRNIYNKTGLFGASEITAAFIDLANTLIRNYKTAYDNSLEFTELSQEVVTAGTTQSPIITSYATADTQIDIYILHFESLISSIKNAITSIQNIYISNKSSVANVPDALNLTVSDYASYVETTEPPFSISSITTATTKQEQLIEIYGVFQSANSGLQTLVHLNSFQRTYESARQFLTDAELSSTAVAVKNKVYDESTVTMDELTTAFRNVLSVVIGRYWGIYNSSNRLGAFAASGTIPTDDNPSTKSLAALKTLYEKYFGTTGLWTLLTDPLIRLVQEAIDTYKTAATDASVAVTQSVIDSDSDVISLYPSPSILENPAETFLTVLASINTKYVDLKNALLNDIRDTADDSIKKYEDLQSDLAVCNPTISTISTIDTDKSSIQTISDIKTLTEVDEKYRKAQADLFNNAQSEQQAFIGKYKKLFNKYEYFRNDSEISKYIVLNSSNLANGSEIEPQSPLSTANSLPTTTMIYSLNNQCTSYDTNNVSLVNHIRTNLSRFIKAFDAEWGKLSDEVRSSYLYISPIPSDDELELPTSTTADKLYDLMNQYGGYTRDSLGSDEATATTISLAAEFTSAESQANALELLYDFNEIHSAVSILWSLELSDPNSQLMQQINDLKNTIDDISSDVSNKLEFAVTVAGDTSFSENRSALLDIIQQQMNTVLIEYKGIYDSYTAFRSAVSGVGELPTLDDLLPKFTPTWTETNGPITMLKYTPPAADVFTQSDSGSLSLFGSIDSDGWELVDTYLPFVEQLQELVQFIQSKVNTFRNTVKPRISEIMTSLSRPGKTSEASDTLFTTMTISRHVRAHILSEAEKALATWFLKTFLVNTFYTGRRYLPANYVFVRIPTVVAKCESYLNTDGSLKSDTFAFIDEDEDEDTLESILSLVSEGLREFAKALGTYYNSTWTMWVTGNRIKPIELEGITKPTFNDDEISNGSEAVRIAYLSAWPILLNGIRNTTKTLLNSSSELTNWLNSSESVRVGSLQTQGLGRRNMNQ